MLAQSKVLLSEHGIRRVEALQKTKRHNAGLQAELRMIEMRQEQEWRTQCWQSSQQEQQLQQARLRIGGGGSPSRASRWETDGFAFPRISNSVLADDEADDDQQVVLGNEYDSGKAVAVRRSTYRHDEVSSPSYNDQRPWHPRKRAPKRPVRRLSFCDAEETDTATTAALPRSGASTAATSAYSFDVLSDDEGASYAP